MNALQWLSLLAGSALLLWISRRSLTNPDCHGFYRFFALEATIILFTLNGPYWFVDRLSREQLVSWALLFFALYFLLDGIRLLRRRGQLDPSRRDPALLGFERTRHLVTEGLYRHIRHPMYASVILLAWGLHLKAPSVTAAMLAATATGFMVLTARVEERECLDHFRTAYRDYMARTRMFIPWLL
ncbi:MAG: isoprenylcysteine carboxylmethyltransferase family protein [Halofilum sp. (in: g-proteobacteria)]